MSSRRREVPVEGSWRIVEGENDSFDTTLLPSLPSDDFENLSSGHQPSLSSGFPTQSSSSQGGLSGASQDSIRDFAKHPDDDQVILREPFRPSLPGAAAAASTAQANKYRTPDPEFRMPLVDVGGERRSSGRSSRTVRPQDVVDEGARRRRPGKVYTGSPTKQRQLRRKRYDDGDDESFDDDDFGHRPPRTIRDHVSESIPSALYDIIVWALGVVGLAFRYAQKPLALMLAIYLCFGGIIIAQNMVTQSIYASLSPICRFPGISLLDLPFCPGGSGSPSSSPLSTNATYPVEFDDLMGVQSKFEQVLETSAEGVSLPFEMKRSESTIRDLRSLVRHSDVQSRDELVLEFDGYIETARATAADLQRFNTHVGSAVDAVISINRWTSRYIDSLAPAPASDESSSSSLADWAAWLFYPFTPSEQAFNERVLLEKYIEHTSLVSDRIGGLILEAQAVLRLLTKAEDHLSLIYDITSRSSASVTSRRDQVFWTLWTLVGANTFKLHNLSQQLSLLKQVESQRNSAVAQVNELILELQSIEAELGNLRERVAEPELLQQQESGSGGRDDLSDPPHRHPPAKVPLSVHIETIDRGVERLEEARRRIRAAENDRVREALARGGVKDEPLIDPR